MTTALGTLARMETSYYDLIRPPKQETRTAAEIIEHVLGGLAKH